VYRPNATMNCVVTCNTAHRFCDNASSARAKKYTGEEVFETFATFHTHIVHEFCFPTARLPFAR